MDYHLFGSRLPPVNPKRMYKGQYDLGQPQYFRYKRGRGLRTPTSNKKFKRNRMGAFGSETKFADSELTATALTTSWVTLNPTTKNSLTAVAQGTTESTHLGRTMYMTSFHMKGDFFLPTVEADVDITNDATVRYVIVMDTDTKGTEVSATDVMDAGQTDDVHAFRNLQHTSRLKVLTDKTFTMRPFVVAQGAVDLFANGARRRHFQYNITFKKPVRVLFSGTTAVVASIVDNSLHFCAISNSTYSVEYQCRLRFKDTV